MKTIVFALLTAICWGVGGYFEKRGLHLGNLPPQLGLTIRTTVAGSFGMLMTVGGIILLPL